MLSSHFARPDVLLAARCTAVLVVLGLIGSACFAWSERSRPQWVMVFVLAYFLCFSALMHIELSGRTNAALKIVLGLFAAYLVGRVLERLTASPRSPAPQIEGEA